MKKGRLELMLKFLYKETSLQYYYSINFTMLDNGRFPRVFTWKEMLQAHIDHEREVYRRGFEYDLRKIENRIHIIDGLLICLARIDEVVSTIKSSASTAAASIALQQSFLLDTEQAKAVLDMKLSRLAKLEVQKLEREKNDLETELDRLLSILNNEELLKKEIEKGLKEVMNKFRDSRRTQILNVEKEEDEPVEEDVAIEEEVPEVQEEAKVEEETPVVEEPKEEVPPVEEEKKTAKKTKKDSKKAQANTN